MTMVVEDSCEAVLSGWLGKPWRIEQEDNSDSDSDSDFLRGSRRHQVECRLGPLMIALMKACRRKFDEVWRSLPSTDLLVMTEDCTDEEVNRMAGGLTSVQEDVADQGVAELDSLGLDEISVQGCSRVTSSSSSSSSTRPSTSSEQSLETSWSGSSSKSFHSLEQSWLTGMHAEYVLCDGTSQPVTIGRLWSGGRSASIRYRCPKSGEQVHRMVKCSSLRVADEDAEDDDDDEDDDDVDVQMTPSPSSTKCIATVKARDPLAECTLDDLYQGLAARGLVLEEPAGPPPMEKTEARSRRFHQPTKQQMTTLAQMLPSASGKSETNQELREPWKVGDEGVYYSETHGQRWHPCEVATITTSQQGLTILALKVSVAGGTDNKDNNNNNDKSSSKTAGGARCKSLVVRLSPSDSRLRRPQQHQQHQLQDGPPRSPSLKEKDGACCSYQQDTGGNAIEVSSPEGTEESQDKSTACDGSVYQIKAEHSAYKAVDGQAGVVRFLGTDSQHSWEFPLCRQDQQLRLIRSLVKTQVVGSPKTLAATSTRHHTPAALAGRQRKGRRAHNRRAAEFPLSEVEKRARFIEKSKAAAIDSLMWP
eukprot:CAMPEP_0206614924 /NCGR_PEP_ID=MMETSP0325_2-20121206/57746_1 /ASSEMBLY_ACC=CAM_ASM_000347 /TAXON_ID=2866 /ORGANISM="Crypthecodinium cohnii, Strain Seligo" /LENGTH=590 /DNA_ID=CAMNT_0054135643 /DNA_START=252 /DNA_END=2021 /DNA_ORIENTATION=+